MPAAAAYGSMGVSPSCLAICFSLVLSGCKVRKYITKSHASSGFTLSEKDGIGEPSRPVMKSLYIAASVEPHLKRCESWKLKGLIGRFSSSVKVAAEGPLPRPVTP